MADILGKPLLEHLIDRLKRCKTLNSIVVATTTEERDDPIEKLAISCGLGCYRGSENDVLGRYLETAEAFEADVIIRVCADNPLTDPGEVDKLVRHHLKTGADYSFNNEPHPKGLPDGAGAEALSMGTLKKVNRLATSALHREHVTLFILENPDLFHIERLDADPELRRPDIKLDVDYAEDLEFIRRIFKGLYKPGEIIKLSEVIDLLGHSNEHIV